MLLAIDVGNTNVKFALFAGSHGEGDRLGLWRIAQDRGWNADRFISEFMTLLETSALSPDNVAAVAVSSVVPILNDVLVHAIRQVFGQEPFIVGPETETGIAIRYRSRASVGADRICNAVAAYKSYGGPAIVVDYGTATKFDVIAANGDFLGGAILPGITISMEALYRHAPHLPRVPFVPPPSVIGGNTLHALQSGILYGFAAQTDSMVARIRKELEAEATVIATGGLAEPMASLADTIQFVDVALTLEGLRLLHARASGSSPQRQ